MIWIVIRSIADPVLRAKAEWVATTLTAAEGVASKIGISPEAVVAQGAVESNWGQSRQGRNGLFGQKVGPGWAGLKVLCTTREFVNDEYITIQDWFRDYATPQECLEDHFAFLNQNSRYRDAGVFAKQGDEAFFYALQAAGYATDPDYAKTCIAVEDTVTDYFMPMFGAGVNPVPLPKSPLMIGSHDPETTLVESALKTLGFYTGPLDQSFGPLLHEAVREFQVSKNLSDDGVVGEETRKALNIL